MGHYDSAYEADDEARELAEKRKETQYRKLLIEKLEALLVHLQDSYIIIDDKEAQRMGRAPKKYESYLKQRLNYKLYDLLLTTRGLKAELLEEK